MVSSAAIAAANAQSTDEIWLVLLTLDHPDLPDPIRVVNNNEDVTSRGNQFIGFPFDITLPSSDPDTPPRAQLVVDNVSRELIEVVRSLEEPPTVLLEVILHSQPNTVELSFDGLVLQDAEYDAQVITAGLGFESIYTEPITAQMTPSKFPGLF